MSHQYLDHRVDSPKGKVHEVFDTKGKEAAIKKALSLDIQKSTAMTWCSSWKNASPKKKKKAAKAAAPAKAPAKKAVKKAAAKKAAPAKAKAKPAKREKLGEAHAAA